MKSIKGAILVGIMTIVVGFLGAGMFSSIGVTDAYMSYVQNCTNAVIFLAGVISVWGYLILQELKYKSNNNN